MSKFLQKIGMDPKWGQGLSSTLKTASQSFKDKLTSIRRKKMANPSMDTSKEIKDLLEEQK